MLTKKGKYGLKALTYLTRLEPGQGASIAEIAQAEGLPKKFLEAILLDLGRAGFVRSRKGRGGGYYLARDPAEIMVGDTVRAMDGPLAPIPCASRTAFSPCEDCADLATCPVRLVMLAARDAMSEVLDHTSLAQMSASGAGDALSREPNLA